MVDDPQRELNAILGDASQEQKRSEGLGLEETESVLGLVDWPVVARDNRDPLPKALPRSHLLNVLLPRIDIGAPLGERCLFDVPLETFTGLVGALGLRGDQVLDAFRWVELADADAFARLVPTLFASSAGFPLLDASLPVVERVCRLYWASTEPTPREAAPGRIRGAIARQRGEGPARVLLQDLQLSGRAFHGQPDRRYPDVGPLLGIAQKLDEGLLLELLGTALERSAKQNALTKLDLIAAIAWDAQADSVEGSEVHLERALGPLRLTGTFSLKNLNQQGRWALKPGRVEARPARVDAAAAKSLLSKWQSGSAVLAQLAAAHPEAITAKPLAVGGPDVAAALAPVASQKALAGALKTILESQKQTLRATSSARVIVDAMAEMPPKLLELAAAKGHVAILRHMLGKPDVQPKHREKARAAAELHHAHACLKALT